MKQDNIELKKVKSELQKSKWEAIGAIAKVIAQLLSYLKVLFKFESF